MPLSFLPESFVSGGILLIVFGSILASMRRLPGQIWRFLERHLFISLHVFDTDESFYWLKIWLGEKLKNAKSKSTLTRRINKNNDDLNSFDDFENYKQISSETLIGKDRRPQTSFILAPGIYFFWFHKKLCWCDYDRKESEGTAGFQKPRETFVIRCLSRNLNLLQEIINESKNLALPLDGKVEIRLASSYSWDLLGRVDSRPLDSVILPGITDLVINDIKKFQNSQEWYSKLGIPYRRGILLTGKPGVGKSSLVLAVASELGMNVNILYLSDPQISDSRLQDLLNKSDKNTIILIEDIDSAFKKRKSRSDNKLQPITFSGLLNALDGLAAQGGRILFMTTNKIEELDPALIRPGRADLKIFVPQASQLQAEILFKRFFPKSKLAGKFASLVPPGMLSMAMIQGHLLRFKENDETAVAKFHETIKEEKNIEEFQKIKEKKDELAA